MDKQEKKETLGNAVTCSNFLSELTATKKEKPEYLSLNTHTNYCTS